MIVLWPSITLITECHSCPDSCHALYFHQLAMDLRLVKYCPSADLEVISTTLTRHVKHETIEHALRALLCKITHKYRIAGNFRGVQFSQMANLQGFCSLIFADTCDHAHYTLHNRTYFAGLLFVDSCLSVKTAKIRPYENFPLYGKH